MALRTQLAALDRRLLPVLALRLRSVTTRVETAVGGVRDDVRGQRQVLRGARASQQVRSMRPVLHAGSHRVLGGLALVLLVAAAALLILGG
ncbi:MAG: hypothetical protein QOJ32_114 [Frankiaceae bacterium]|nr:hypothetical protein [Frankiaceae bacterium]